MFLKKIFGSGCMKKEHASADYHSDFDKKAFERKTFEIQMSNLEGMMAVEREARYSTTDPDEIRMHETNIINLERRMEQCSKKMKELA